MTGPGARVTATCITQRVHERTRTDEDADWRLASALRSYVEWVLERAG